MKTLPVSSMGQRVADVITILNLGSNEVHMEIRIHRTKFKH